MNIFSYFLPLFFFIFPLCANEKCDLSKCIVTGNGFRSLADHIYDERNKRISFHTMQNGDIVFVKTDMLQSFFEKIHPKIPRSYILITHNSDEDASQRYRYHLDEPKLLAWFGQNANFQHPKFYPIPIGIANTMFAFGDLKCFAKMLEKKDQYPKQNLLYANFTPDTHPDRYKLYHIFSLKDFCYFQKKRISLEEYLQDVLQSEYVLSPRGNGLDTYRTWESMLMGAIPIVQHSHLDPLFEDMRVLLVNDFCEITREFLEKQLLLLQLKPHNNEKLYLNYYYELIKSLKDSAYAVKSRKMLSTPAKTKI